MNKLKNTIINNFFNFIFDFLQANLFHVYQGGSGSKAQLLELYKHRYATLQFCDSYITY